MKPTDDPTKQEEIDALRRFALSVPLNSYLKSLLSPQLLDNFENAVRSDICADLVGELKAAIDTAWQEQTRTAAATTQIDTLRRILAQTETERDTLREQLREAESNLFEEAQKIYAIQKLTRNSGAHAPA